MKKGLWLILALALLWPCKAMALEAELESILDATQAQYDLSAWEESYGKLRPRFRICGATGISIA